jgi:hypothetical protein
MGARLVVAARVLAVATGIALHVKAGGDLVSFPAGYLAGVLYGTVDRADLKQHRELCASKIAADAAKAGQPLPSGSLLTMATFKAKLDAAGNPEKGADGRFIKGDPIGIFVMQKRTGWGGEYPPELRNGEWEYQAFDAARAVNTKAVLKNCFECHRPKAADDFVFSMAGFKAAQSASLPDGMAGDPYALDRTLDSGRRSSSVHHSRTQPRSWLVFRRRRLGTKRRSRNISRLHRAFTKLAANLPAIVRLAAMVRSAGSEGPDGWHLERSTICRRAGAGGSVAAIVPAAACFEPDPTQ